MSYCEGYNIHVNICRCGGLYKRVTNDELVESK